MLDVSRTYPYSGSVAASTKGKGVWAVVNILQTATLLRDELEIALAAKSGLSLAEHDVMMQLHHHGGRLLMSELADLVLFTQSGITRLVDRLESKGFVRRQLSTEDRRLTYATLTQKGKAKLEHDAMPLVDRVVEERFNRYVSAEDAHRLRQTLVGVLQGNEWWDERQRTHHLEPKKPTRSGS
jgi:DNA-binding MarR family transcriptional regulator